MKPLALPCSEVDSPENLIRCTNADPELVIKYKPTSGVISKREVDLIMSILNEVLDEVDRLTAMEAAANTAAGKSSPSYLKEELSTDLTIQPGRDIPSKESSCT